MAKVSFWKVLAFFGTISSWAQNSLTPDADGVVRVTTQEMADLAESMCDVFGWKAEIVVEK
jgi:hypothetical protein